MKRQMQGRPEKGGVVRLWSSFQGKVQSVGATVRQYPSTAIVPVIVFTVLAAIGVAVVIIASNSQVDTNQRQATLDAAAAAESMKQVIHDMMQPIYSLGLFIEAFPHYPAVVKDFPTLTKSLLEQVDHLTSSSFIQLIPKGQITHAYPVNNYSQLSIGLDILPSPVTQKNLQQPPGKRLILHGPTQLAREQKWGMIGTTIIFIPNVTRNDTFGMPSSLPVDYPPNLSSLCYDEATQSKFWGMVSTITYFESLVNGESSALVSLRQKGYNFQLVQKPTNVPATPGVRGPDGGSVTLLARTEGDLRSDPVLATVDLDSVSAFVPWTLMITTSSGWEPSWRDPLIATVVVVAAIIGILLFILLLYMRQHQILLYSLMPRKMVQSMFQGEAFDAIVKGQDLHSHGVQGARMLDAGTPVERLMDILSQFIMGRVPETSDVVALRAAIVHGGDVLFEPQDLRGQLQFNKDLPDDVVDALLQQLQGRGAEAADPEPRPIVKPGSATSLPDDDLSMSSLSVALSLIMRNQSCLEHLGSLASTDSAASARNGPVVALGGKAYLRGPAKGSVSSPCLLVPPEDGEGDGHRMYAPGPEGQGGDGTALQASTAQMQDKLGPQACPLDQVEQLLEASYGSWTFNAFELAEATNGHPLSVMLFFLLVRSGLMRDMNLNPSVAARLSLAIEDGYCPNPYHNKTHAADVLQTMHTILVNSGMVVAAGQKGYCPPDTLLACLLAAAGHDVGHSGVTNDFLIHSEDQLSTLYSDKSPMENHHLAHLWTLLRSPSLNILSTLPKEERSKVRKTVIDLVSATDMKSHFSMLSQFSVMHQLSGNNTIARASSSGRSSGAPQAADVPSSAAARHSTPGARQCVPIDEAEQMLCLQIALKCADLGHIAETTEVHCQWVSCLEEEFFAQGDRERSLGLPISPLFDRTKPGASKSQVGFYDFVVLPLFHNFCCAFPGTKPMVDLTLTTYKFWKSSAPGVDVSMA